ncbi:hypothetical protein WT60_14960 [Burkholderia sp. MSMB617WGS]|uniref:hypothetical protein n=1 Tax=Burkholderia TaxID=32008 RepID=UPI000531DD43|nr:MULTISPECIES: hypothetical protein [Burkholderia]AOJ81858.1 hypothetical protein WS86_15400 [Burkholderia savannae]AOK48006.1 hypothetical protein WT60_14960 [Burkholderia sp. MSMB617WGS]KGS00707.1 hypothetical protein X946_3755 [Burkholderia sp. ABCPW 111]KVK91532.1 hypothetical protein WS91_25500 [Burkholderia sp. MSMB1498]
MWPLDAYLDNRGNDFSLAASKRFETARFGRIRHRRAAAHLDGDSGVRRAMGTATPCARRLNACGPAAIRGTRDRVGVGRDARMTARRTEPRGRSRRSARIPTASFR